MHTGISGGKIRATLNVTECKCLRRAADICEGVALVNFEPAATVARDLRDLAGRDSFERNSSTLSSSEVHAIEIAAAAGKES